MNIITNAQAAALKDQALAAIAELEAQAACTDDAQRLEEIAAKIEEIRSIKVATCTCATCGRPVETNLLAKGRKKTQHNECRELEAAIARVNALLDVVVFAEGEKGDACVKRMRRSLFMPLNGQLQARNVKRASDSKERKARKGYEESNAPVFMDAEKASAWLEEMAAPPAPAQPEAEETAAQPEAEAAQAPAANVSPAAQAQVALLIVLKPNAPYAAACEPARIAQKNANTCSVDAKQQSTGLH